MRLNCLRPVWPRKFVHITDSKHTLAVSPNALDSQFGQARRQVDIGAINIELVSHKLSQMSAYAQMQFLMRGVAVIGQPAGMRQGTRRQGTALSSGKFKQKPVPSLLTMRLLNNGKMCFVC